MFTGGLGTMLWLGLTALRFWRVLLMALGVLYIVEVTGLKKPLLRIAEYSCKTVQEEINSKKTKVPGIHKRQRGIYNSTFQQVAE